MAIYKNGQIFATIGQGGGGQGGGSNVTITPTLQEGVEVAKYSIDGVQGSIKAPEGGDNSRMLTWDEYQALPEEEKQSDTTYYITDKGGSGGGGGTEVKTWHKYSEGEKIVGEWINGKPLYENTFVLYDLYWNPFPYTLDEIPDIDLPISARCMLILPDSDDDGGGFTYIGNANHVSNGSSYDTDASYDVSINMFSRGYIGGFIGDSIYNMQQRKDLVIILQYTKTTD